MTGEKVKHPARFSEAHLAVAAPVLAAEARRLGLDADDLRVLDPFAGVGTVHALPYATTGVEIEPEWANVHPATVVGDATALPFRDDSFHALVTSPTYGNRMADTYDRSGDTCQTCKGDPIAVQTCEPCDRSGLRATSSSSYRLALGRMPSPGSTATLRWGPDYRRLHRQAWEEAVRVLDTRRGNAPIAVVNLSDSVRTAGTKANRRAVYPPVVEWHLCTLIGLGFYIERVTDLPTRRYRFGANSTRRVAAEHLLILRLGRPTIVTDLPPTN